MPPADAPKTWPVIIVGGGPVGLCASIYLSQLGISHLLFERYPGTSIHPKACGLNQRSTEIFRELGVERAVLEARAPPETCGQTAWFTSLGPQGREIYRRDAWGGWSLSGEYGSASPSPYIILPQIRLEPVLQRRALELNADGIHYRSEVVDVREIGDKATVTVQHRRGGQEAETQEYDARFVIGADGGRGLTDKLGIAWLGERDIVDMVTAHIRSPISQHHDPKPFITWLINPALGGTIGTGYLYHLGPYPSRPETEEWVFAAGMRPDDPAAFDTDAMVRRVHRSLAIPDLPVELLSTSHWRVNAVVAERYRSKGGRVFLAGDAAHRIPPWGALGLNSGLQDVQNLIWKLGLVIKAGEGNEAKYDRLLDTYDEERRPIGERVARTSLHNLQSHTLVMDNALGVSASKSVEENEDAMKTYFDPARKGHKEVGEAVKEAQRSLDGEFHAIGAEVGWFYPSADIDGEGKDNRHGGSLLENGELDTNNYFPSTIPGHHVPHAWLQKGDTRLSTRDLSRAGRFALLTRTPGIWEGVQSEMVDVHVIGGETGWKDEDGTWEKMCGVGPKGAVLVRPDRIVGWRAINTDEKTVGDFGAVMERILRLDKPGPNL
ncbi:FAD binding domain-containing protein [Lineolata rhizophorae]|uniref:FAD binding domain-containing protein n=1 Tax=Lineolata rhizophorae TaxID=578093 RepID=A0A6A6NLH8_9PEZI|nr:FAD binding domain-containing protein [Lineolata rhizophorae]